MIINKKTLETRLKTIINMIDESFNENKPVMLHTAKLISDLREVASGDKEIKKDEHIDKTIEIAAQRTIKHVIISCDASIKINPGGPASVGVVIEQNKKKDLELVRHSKSNTNNQAEYDAIYFGLTCFLNVCNNPQALIEIRSDSQVIVSQLNGEMKCHDQVLKQKRDSIWKLAKACPSPIKFEWRPRNSTPGLKKANYLAQDILGVKLH